MITRSDIGELARFESKDNTAVTFYYQPWTPKDKSHREEQILVKDLVRDTLRRAEREGKNGATRHDLERIQQISEQLHGNCGRAKAVFACSAHSIWREFDLPARLVKTELHVNERFHLRPLTAIADVLPRVGIVVTDRTKTRILELWMDEIKEIDRLSWDLPRRGKSDGWSGFDAGHTERKVDNEAMHNFKELADKVKSLQERNGWEKIVFGVRDETWPEIEPQLHTYAKQKLIGHFAIDPAGASNEEIKQEAERILNEHRSIRTEGLVREVIGQTQRDSRGALGLRHVLNALERGEVQALLLGRNFRAEVVQCRKCSHIDTRMVKTCAVCGGSTGVIDDVADILLGTAVRNNIEIVHIPETTDPGFAVKGSIGALLRFRADHNTNGALQRAS